MEVLNNYCNTNISLLQLEMEEIEKWTDMDKDIPVTETLTKKKLI